MRRTAWTRRGGRLITLLTVAGIGLTLLPYFWMLSSSLKTGNEVFELPLRWLPRDPQWSNYPNALTRGAFGLYFFNSAVVALAVMAGNLLFCSLAGYGLAKFRFPYREASFRAMDYVLYKADQAGVRLLISLVNYWGDFGGMPQYVRWCSPGSSTDAFYTNASCRQLYKNYVSHLVNRVNTYNGRLYRNDPTIFAWELANEPRSGDRTGQLVRGWIAEMAAYIKSIDSNHMVTTGEEGFDLTTAGYNSGAYNNQSWLFDGTNGISFTQNTADPNIDFAQIHLYPEYWNFSPSIGSTWIADHTQIAPQLRKPLLLGEFGHAANSAAVYDEWLRTFDTENGGVALV